MFSLLFFHILFGNTCHYSGHCIERTMYMTLGCSWSWSWCHQCGC